jgi:hypothetical protein
LNKTAPKTAATCKLNGTEPDARMAASKTSRELIEKIENSL